MGCQTCHGLGVMQRYVGVGRLGDPEPCADCEAGETIERLTRERDEAREMLRYQLPQPAESKKLQEERDTARAEVHRLRAALQNLVDKENRALHINAHDWGQARRALEGATTEEKSE